MVPADKRALPRVGVVPARSQRAAVLTATFSSLATRTAGRAVSSRLHLRAYPCTHRNQTLRENDRNTGRVAHFYVAVINSDKLVYTVCYDFFHNAAALKAAHTKFCS